jgi:hypothetical protein
MEFVIPAPIFIGINSSRNPVFMVSEIPVCRLPLPVLSG